MNNKKAVEIFDEMKQNNVPVHRLGEFFHVGEDESINIDALARKLRRTKENIMKKKGKYRMEYENEIFSIPVQTLTKEKTKLSKFETFESEAANLAIASFQKDLKTKEEEQASTIMEKEKAVKEKIQSMEISHKNEIEDMKKNTNTIKKQMVEWRNKAKSRRNENLLLCRKRNRDEGKVMIAKKYPKLLKEYEEVTRKQKEMEETIKNLKTENETFYGKVQNVEIPAVDIGKNRDLEQSVEPDQESSTLKSRVKDLEAERDYLLDMLDDNVDIQVFDEDTCAYSTQLRECVMNLTTLNVATKNVAPVINTVLKLANKTVNSLPSRQTIDNIVCEKVVVGHKQVGSSLKGQKNICLYGDETRKKGKTYQTFLVSDEEKNLYFLGLRDMYNKASSTTLDTFKEILADISNACEEMLSAGEASRGHHILSNICSFMSDRAKVNIAFTDLLEQFKLEILSQIADGWNDLTENEKLLCSRVNNFFCALHLLVNMAECASPILQNFDKMHDTSEGLDITDEDQDDSCTIKSSEAMVLTLLRFCAKCFSCGGDEKSGAHADFKAYCNSIQEKVMFIPFRGNRFNIIFLISQFVYYHKENILKFLQEIHGANNFIQKIILSYIKKPLLLAACKVLGLISKLITAPFWRLIERNIHIFDLNTYFQTLSSYLLRQSQDATGFVSGEEYPFEEVLLEKDKLFSNLIKPDEDNDLLAIQLSQMLFCGFHKLISTALKEHLPGGAYSDPSETLREKSKSVIPHNVMSERVFGMLDRFITSRPNASTITNEAFIMFAFNKSSQWLDSLPEKERVDILTKSINEGREFRKQFQKRCTAISEKRKEALNEKKLALEKKSHNQQVQREKQTSDIIYYGLWQSVERMHTALGEIKSLTEKRKALEAQLRFRQNMLKQAYKEKDVFRFSEKGKKHTVNKLKENLTKLIEAAYHGPTDEKVHKRTPLLVGKRVKHRFEDGEHFGNVISVVPGFVNFYNIVYNKDVGVDEITQNVYTYRLLEDYQKGDLEIIPEVKVMLLLEFVGVCYSYC